MSILHAKTATGYVPVVCNADGHLTVRDQESDLDTATASQGHLSAIEGYLTTVAGDTTSSKASLQAVDATLTAVDTNLATAKDDIAASKASLAAVDATLTTVDTNLAAAKDDIAASKGLLQGLDSELQIANSALADLRGIAYRSLREQRRLGRCFISRSSGPAAGITTLNALTLVNPAGSGKTLYVYNVSYGVSFEGQGSSEENVLIRLTSFAQGAVSGGTSVGAPSPAKIGTGVSSALATVVSSVGAFTILEQLRARDRDDVNLRVLDFQEEFIEVGPGLGLGFQLDVQTAITVQYDVHFRFIEAPEADPL